MHRAVWIMLGAIALCVPCPAAPSPESVAVLFNSRVAESRKLALHYCEERGIPLSNLIGLDMPVARDISREDFDRDIAFPLRDEFDRKRWWTRARQSDGMMVPVMNQIRVLVIIRGVPLRILPETVTGPDGKPVPKPVDPKNPLKGRDEASVDSELAMFGVEVPPVDGVLENRYYKSKRTIAEAGMPFLVLTARIDAASYSTCERMIEDALVAEKSGLWGMAYVDIANKYPQGDEWLESIVKTNLAQGIPTVVDRFDQTFPRNYPMTHASLYYGWYDWNISGPFLSPQGSMRRGAIAMHLHSFSAEQLDDPKKNWCAGLLECGAAATVGNVYEPYLHLTHDFGIIHQRLLDGYSWVEACWMAMPVTSWQGVVLGDPLYQPFVHFKGSGHIEDEDKPFRAVRAAMMRWEGDNAERQLQLKRAAERTKSGELREALALEQLAEGLTAEAAAGFREAKMLYPSDEDKLRQEMHIAALDRAAGRKDVALRGLNDALMQYRALPEAAAAKEWIDILQPPAPPSKPQ